MTSITLIGFGDVPACDDVGAGCPLDNRRIRNFRGCEWFGNDDGPASGLVDRNDPRFPFRRSSASSSRMGSSITSLARVSLVVGDDPSIGGLASSLSNSNSNTSSLSSLLVALGIDVDGVLSLDSGLGDPSSSVTSRRCRISGDSPIPDSSATTLLMSFLSYQAVSLAHHPEVVEDGDMVTHLTILDSRGLPLIWERRFVDYMLEFLSVLHDVGVNAPCLCSSDYCVHTAWTIRRMY